MTIEERFAAILEAVVTLDREFSGGRAGLLRQVLEADKVNYACSRILPTFAMSQHLSTKFREMARAAERLARMYESLPSQPPTKILDGS